MSCVNTLEDKVNPEKIENSHKKGDEKNMILIKLKLIHNYKKKTVILEIIKGLTQRYMKLQTLSQTKNIFNSNNILIISMVNQKNMKLALNEPNTNSNAKPKI